MLCGLLTCTCHLVLPRCLPRRQVPAQGLLAFGALPHTLSEHTTHTHCHQLAYNVTPSASSLSFKLNSEPLRTMSSLHHLSNSLPSSELAQNALEFLQNLSTQDPSVLLCPEGVVAKAVYVSGPVILEFKFQSTTFCIHFLSLCNQCLQPQ